MRCVAVGIALLIVGCGGTRIDPFRGIEILEDNEAPLPEPVDGDIYPEVLSVVSGKRGFDWGHGRAFIKAPAADVWAAIEDPEVVMDRGRNNDRQSFELGVMPEWDLSYNIHYEVTGIISVEWTELWGGILTIIEDCRSNGDENCDSLPWALVKYQKVEGTTFIPLIEGTILLFETEENVTEIQLIQHLDAASSDASDIRQTFRDQYSSILARVRGEPLPRF
ncbi:MAG: hypothetical protein AAGF12_31750 [Myxococcota bacterium]